VRERFDPERQMDAFVALYEDVLTAAGRTPAARAPAG